MIHQDFEDKSVLELNAVLKHIRMGKNHLEQVLDSDQLTQLFKTTELDDKQKENIKSDKQETSGNIALVLHTVLTGSLGAILGIFTFTGIRSPSIPVLIGALIIAIFIAIAISYGNFRLTRQKAMDHALIQKISLIELQVLNRMVLYHEQDLKETCEEVKHYLSSFNKGQPIQEFHDNFMQISVFVKNHLQATGNQFSKDQSTFLEKLDLILQRLADQKHDLNDAKEGPDHCIKTQSADVHYIDKLVNQELPDIEPVENRTQWIKTNIPIIITGLLPTFIGGFGSMFVFLTGIPKILEVFHIPAETILRNQSWISGSGIGTALLITFYYGYSHVHSKYKEFIRKAEVEKTNKHIAEETSHLINISAKLHCFLQVKHILQKLIMSV